MGILVAQFSMAQVGVNTETPKATMDVMVNTADPSKADGFIAPRLTGNALKTKDSLYGTAQVGTIVYATAAASPVTSKTINVTEAGYYYFDGTIWVKIGAGNSSIEPWNAENTSTQANANNQNIYQNGNVGIGNFTNSATRAKLDVKGNIYGEWNMADYYSVFATADPNIGVNHLSFSQGGLLPESLGGTATKYSTIQQWLGSTYIQERDGNKISHFQLQPDKMELRSADGSLSSNIRNNVNAGGVAFFFNDQSTGITKTYIFPTNQGTAGQVLKTNGAASEAQLYWADSTAESVTLKAPGGNCFKITVNDSGVLSTTATACP